MSRLEGSPVRCRSRERESFGHAVVDDNVANVRFPDQVDVEQAEGLVEIEQLRIDQAGLGRYRVDATDGVEQDTVVVVGRNVRARREVGVGPLGGGERGGPSEGSPPT